MAVSNRVVLSADRIRAIGKALADPRRHEILKQIATCDRATGCQALREQQEISAATLSHHLKELEHAGLVDIVREGKFAKVTVNRKVLNGYVDYLKTI